MSRITTLLSRGRRRAVGAVEYVVEAIVASLISVIVAVVVYSALFPVMTTNLNKTLLNSTNTAYVGASLAPLVSIIPTLITIFFTIGVFFLSFELLRLRKGGQSPL